MVKLHLEIVLLGGLIVLGGLAVLLAWAVIGLLSLVFMALLRLQLVLIITSLGLIFAGSARISRGTGRGDLLRTRTTVHIRRRV